jgi:hypothetical protein
MAGAVGGDFGNGRKNFTLPMKDLVLLAVLFYLLKRECRQPNSS